MRAFAADAAATARLAVFLRSGPSAIVPESSGSDESVAPGLSCPNPAGPDFGPAGRLVVDMGFAIFIALALARESARLGEGCASSEADGPGEGFSPVSGISVENACGFFAAVRDLIAPAGALSSASADGSSEFSSGSADAAEVLSDGGSSRGP